MSIQIGAQSLATSRPADLDGALIAATGCSAAEHTAMLSRPATPFQIARALAPFVTDTNAAALAELIAAGDADEVRRAVVALLAPAPATAPATSAEA